MLIDTARAWRTLPAFGSLARKVDISDPRHPHFLELRLGASRYALDGWQEPTDGLVLVLLGVSVARGKLVVRAPQLATLSLHSLARRYQRGQPSDASVLDDISQLAWEYPRAVEGELFNCVAGDGTWTGHTARAERDLVLHVQTYLDGTKPALPAGIRDLESLLPRLPMLYTA
jgi:hypothetical protein